MGAKREGERGNQKICNEFRATLTIQVRLRLLCQCPARSGLRLNSTYLYGKSSEMHCQNADEIVSKINQLMEAFEAKLKEVQYEIVI
jgi:hypothetical protein